LAYWFYQTHSKYFSTTLHNFQATACWSNEQSVAIDSFEEAGQLDDIGYDPVAG